MRALRATGSCYHSQVRCADKLTMTAEPSQGVCEHACACVHYAHMGAHMCVCASTSLKTEICQWLWRLWAYLRFLQIPNSQWQDRREREAYKRERGFLPKAIHSATSTGAIFHKIKAPLFRETCCFRAMIYREYLEAVGTCSSGMPMWEKRLNYHEYNWGYRAEKASLNNHT